VKTKCCHALSADRVQLYGRAYMGRCLRIVNAVEQDSLVGRWMISIQKMASLSIQTKGLRLNIGTGD